MPWEAWFTLILTVGTLVVMARNIMPPDGALLLSAGVLAVASLASGHQHDGHSLLPGIDTIASFFGSSILWAVAALFVVAKGLVETGAADRIAGPILGSRPGRAGPAGAPRSPLLRATVPLLAMAPFLSNTTPSATRRTS